MRRLLLILIAFIAVVTFIRAFEKKPSQSIPREIVEFTADNQAAN